MKYKPQQQTYIDYCVQMITYIITTIGPREPGSHAERMAQEVMIGDLKNYADTVTSEFFEVHPYALMGWVVIDAFLLIFGVFFYNFQHRVIAFCCSLVSVVFLVLQFILYKEFMDPIFPRTYSANVIAVLKPTGEVKRRAIFNGHTDSQYEWWFNYLGGGHLLAFIIIVSIIGCCVSCVVQVFIYSEYKNWFAISQICLLPFYVCLLFFTNWNYVVPGANDNLTGCVISMSVLKYLKDNNIRLENTEVVIMLAGCEECGLRGAKAYARAHPLDNVETAFFCFDTIRDVDQMAIYYRDMTGTVAHDMRVCNIMKKAGELSGLDLPFKILFFGSTDGAAISQAGIPAASFVAMDTTPASFYHTRTDDYDNLGPEAIGHAVDIAIGSLFIFDEKGLNGQL